MLDFFAYPSIILEYPIQIWTLQVITMISIRWTTHDSHWSTCQNYHADMASFCVPENHNSCTRNGDVLNHRPAVVETKYVYLYTPNDISKIMILTPTILHEPTNESFLNTTPSVAFRMSFQRRYQHDTFPTREIWNKLQTQEPFLIHTPHGGNNYTQSILSPPSLNQSPVTSNIHCWWW